MFFQQFLFGLALAILFLLFADVFREPVAYAQRWNIPETNGGVEVIDRIVVHLLGDLALQVWDHELGRIKAIVPQLGFDDPVTFFHVFFPVVGAEELANLIAGPPGRHQIQPVAARARRRRRGQNIDNIPVFDLVIQWHDPPVDLSPRGMVPHFGVNLVGHI